MYHEHDVGLVGFNKKLEQLHHTLIDINLITFIKQSIMECPYSYIKTRMDVNYERIIMCEHSRYLCPELADTLKRYNKHFVSNRECQFVGELSYRDCPLYKATNR